MGINRFYVDLRTFAITIMANGILLREAPGRRAVLFFNEKQFGHLFDHQLILDCNYLPEK
jgi:hypothetical protein